MVVPVCMNTELSTATGTYAARQKARMPKAKIYTPQHSKTKLSRGKNLARVRNAVSFDVGAVGAKKARCARVSLAEEEDLM